MMNLIPPEAKRMVVAEYWVRVVSVWLWLISIALLVTLVMAAPVHFLISNVNENLLGKYDEVKQQQADYEAAIAEVKAGNDLIALLEQEQKTIPFSVVLTALDDVGASNNVKIRNASFSAETGTISVVGYAPTRSDLSAFVSALETHDFFEKPELPISNLAKDRDITFSLTVVLTENNT